MYFETILSFIYVSTQISISVMPEEVTNKYKESTQVKTIHSRKSICQPRLPENERNKSFMQSTEEIKVVGE